MVDLLRDWKRTFCPPWRKISGPGSEEKGELCRGINGLLCTGVDLEPVAEEIK